MKTYFLLFLLQAGSLSLNAQDSSEIETDRPDQTETPALVPKNYFQVELGFNKETENSNNFTWLLPAALLKYGLSHRVELRLEAAYLSQHTAPELKPTVAGGVDFVEVGTKLFLCNQKKLRPKASIIAHVGLPFFTGQNFQPKMWETSARFTFQHTVSDVISISSNWEMKWFYNSLSPAFGYTFAPGFNLSKRWYFYLELFGFVGNAHLPDHNVDGGIAFLINQNIKIDFSAGAGLSKAAMRNYMSLGFSCRGLIH